MKEGEILKKRKRTRKKKSNCPCSICLALTAKNFKDIPLLQPIGILSTMIC
jgi:hypothetical protein